MAQCKHGDYNSIGVDDDTWKSLPKDEAKSLLWIFATQNAESRALGTVLVSAPNGKDLYVTPRISILPA